MGALHPATLETRGIDREHQVQVRLMQAVTAAIRQGDAWKDLLDQLAQFTRAHFLSEELLMRLYGYPDYDDHIRDHARMLEWIEQIAARDGQRECMLHAVNELTAVFLRHIGSRDQRLHVYLDEL